MTEDLKPIPVAIVDPPDLHYTTVHLCDVLQTLEAIHEELVSIRQLLEDKP